MEFSGVDLPSTLKMPNSVSSNTEGVDLVRLISITFMPIDFDSKEHEVAKVHLDIMRARQLTRQTSHFAG